MQISDCIRAEEGQEIRGGERRSGKLKKQDKIQREYGYMKNYLNRLAV